MSDSAALFRKFWPLLQRNRPISYSSNLAQIVKSVKAAILLSQMIYWTKKGVEVKANDGWFRKQAEHWTIETGLTRHEQDTARKLLVELSFLEIRHKIREGKKGHGEVHYRLNLEKIGNALADLIGNQILAMNPLNLDDLQSDSEIVRQLLGKHVSYHRILVDISGGTTAALLLSKMIYLQRRAFSSNGGEWFSVTCEYYRQELGMNRRQQESARKALVQRDLIIEALLEDELRHNRRLYQQVNVATVMAELEKSVVAQSAEASAGIKKEGSSTPMYKTGNLKSRGVAQNRQPESDDGCGKRTWKVDGNVHGRLPETSLYTNEELQGLRTTTTTTTARNAVSTCLSAKSIHVVVDGEDASKNEDQAAGSSPLLLPKGITGDELKDFMKWVKKALPHRQQLLIDEFEYRRKTQVIRSAVGYIRHLVQSDLEAKGELELEGAYGVARRREEAAKQEVATQEPPPPRTEAGIEQAKGAAALARSLLKARQA